jgi:hypothetical protein
MMRRIGCFAHVADTTSTASTAALILLSLSAGTVMTMAKPESRPFYDDAQWRRMLRLSQSADESIAQYLAPSLTPPAVFDSRSILEKIVIKAYGEGASTVSITERHCLHPGLTSTLSQRGCETWSAERVHGQYVENVRELPALTPHDTMAREAPAFVPASLLWITGAGIVGEHAWHRRQRKCQLLQPFHTRTHRLIHVRLAPKERRKSRNANIDAMGQQQT